MITRIREVRRAKKMTLDDVAKACTPPTTPQTVGRLETGTRTVSVGWLNRIAAALGVDAADLVGLTVAASVGDYRAGDEIWCQPLDPDGYGQALNRDVIVPRPAGRFLFGRLIGREGNKLQLIPPGAGGRQQVVADSPWVAMAVKLVRSL